MTGLWLPVLYVLFLWWFSTGLVVLADRKLRSGALALASLATLGALLALYLTADSATPADAFVGFTAGLALWGWHEVSFLSGTLTGPRRETCPADARGWRRFGYALGTLLHHELAVAATVLALAALLHGSDNALGLWTFLLLWAMRLSAKLNLFLGVPNLTQDLLPARLGYLVSYCPRRPINALFPISVTLATLLTVWLAAAAWTAPAGSFAETACALLATLSALGVIEHWFLVLPIRDAALWRWYLERSAPTPGEPAETNPMKKAPTQDPLATRALAIAAMEGRRP